MNTATRQKNPITHTSKNRIFLSHSGAQKSFVRWLFTRLSRLYTPCSIFFDKAMLGGVDFVEDIFQAAKECELAIVVMSPEYFKSNWPMIELAAFLEAQKSSPEDPKKPVIFPLYYQVTVEQCRDRELRDIWHEAWKNNPKRVGHNTLDCWEESLNALIPRLNGCVIGDKSEEDYIEEIVTKVCELVAPRLPYGTQSMQGLGRLQAEFKEKFKCLNPSDPVRFFGMYGIFGTGKTKMSQLLCNQMSPEFMGKVCHVEFEQTNWRSKLLEVLCTWSTGRSTTQAGQDPETLLQQEIPKHRLFLVLDNVQTGVTSVSRAFVKFCSSLEFKAGSVVLITSACSREMLFRTFQNIKWKEVFPVPTLQKEEAECLLREASLSALDSKEDITKFVQQCYLGFEENNRQYHPLALEVLGGHISQHPELVDGKDIMFRTLEEKCDVFRDQNITSVKKTMYFDIILSLPQDRRFSSRFLVTQEDFCEWYAFIVNMSVGTIMKVIDELKMQALLVIEDCRNYWGMDNRPCHRFLIHDLYREIAIINAKRENHSDKCVLYETGDGQLNQKSRINVQNNAKISSLEKGHLCNCSDEAKIMRVVSCANITKLDLKGLGDLRSLEIRHCPNLKTVSNLHHLKWLVCLLWEGCDVKFPSLKEMTRLKLLIIKGGATNSSTMGRLSKLPCLRQVLKKSIAKMEGPPNLKDCGNLEVLHLSRLQDLLEFPHLGSLALLVKLEAESCPKVRSLGEMTKMTRLEHLYLHDFGSLEELPDLGGLIALKHLNVTKCPKVFSIPTLQNLTKLTHLCLDTLPIQQIPGIDHLVKLKQLRCCHSNLKILPNLRLCTELDHLDVSNTPVSKLESVGNLKNLKKFEAISCMNMDKLPRLPSFTEVVVRDSLYEKLQNKNSSRT